MAVAFNLCPINVDQWPVGLSMAVYLVEQLAARCFMNESVNAKRLALLICFVAMAAVGTSSARADDGFGGYAGHQFPWFGYGNNGPAAYSLGNIPAPPYFALHPPVYYSHPVPRTYGRSPFACSCGCHEMGSRAVAVRVVENPHIKVKPNPPAANNADKPVKVAASPQRVANPFYENHGRDATLGD